jgi:hypothetical protein
MLEELAEPASTAVEAGRAGPPATSSSLGIGSLRP